MRDFFRITETTCEHTFDADNDYGHRETVRYWVNQAGGYVWCFNSWGYTVQPYDGTGRTWTARNGAEIRELIKAERRRARREWAR